MIDRLITSTPELTKADVLELRIDNKGFERDVNIIAGVETYKYITSNNQKFHYLAYGLKGDVRNIRAMLRLIINISGKFTIDVISEISVFNTEDRINIADMWTFHTFTVNKIRKFFNDSDHFFAFRENDDFRNFVEAMAYLCKCSATDILLFIFKFFRLPEIYLIGDIDEMNRVEHPFEIAMDSTSILRSQRIVDYTSIKKKLMKANLMSLEAVNTGNWIKIRMHNTKNLLKNTAFLPMHCNIDLADYAFYNDVQYP